MSTLQLYLCIGIPCGIYLLVTLVTMLVNQRGNDRLGARFDQVDGRFDKLDQGFDRLDAHFDKLEAIVNRIKAFTASREPRLP